MNDSSVPLPQLDRKVSRVGFGCCPMGRHGWGEVGREDLIAAVLGAVDRGISFFDTADVYGLGESERTLGEALRGIDDAPVVATKFGVRVENGHTRIDNSRHWLSEALEGSLRRLRIEAIDLYQLHYWDEQRPMADIIDDLQRLVGEGKIRSFGVTNVDLAQHGIFGPVDGLASHSHEYSLAQRRNEVEIRRTHQLIGLAFLAWGSLGQGILSGRYDRSTRLAQGDRRLRPEYVNFHGARRERNLAIVDELRRIAERYPGRTIPQLAIRWILDVVPNSVALVGVKRLEQVHQNAGALGWSLDQEDVDALTAIATTEPPDRAAHPSPAE
jgi:aryl-alcohol dehydrogenase-like predicted oxidoreductase